MARSMNSKQNESDTFHEAIKCSHATLEYMGLVSWSIISRSSAAIIDGVQKITETVGRNAAEPFFALKYGIGKASSKKPYVDDKIKSIEETIKKLEERLAFSKKPYVDERVKSIEETIKKLEERLAFLEKHGVRISERDYQEKKKELDKERKDILSLIVEENKQLRDLLKT